MAPGVARPQQPGPIEPRTNGLAITAFVLGLLGFALLPVALGHIALRQIRRRGDAGTGLAAMGLVLGYAATVVYAALVLVVIWGTIRAATS